MTRNNTTISFSVLSGKGGVGKSNLALNLCCGLHRLGRSVLLMDADMGLANIDVLLGISPDRDIQHIFLENRNPSDILVPIGTDGTAGFDLLPANSGMAELADLDRDMRAVLRTKLNPLAEQYDFCCLDIGAGIAPTALSFAAMTAVRVLVVTPEPTSLTDGYALMKVLAATRNENLFHVLVNQVENAAEADMTYKRLASVCDRFLGFTPEYIGFVRNDRAVVDAVRRQRPFLQMNPASPAAKDCMGIAQKLNMLRMSRLQTGAVEEPLRNTEDGRWVDQ